MLKRLVAAAAAALFLVAAYADDKPAANSKPQVAQEIFTCLAPGLPKDWRKTWVVVKELESAGKERRFEADFRYSRSAKDSKGTPLPGVGCEQGVLAKKILGLNEYLAPEKRNWSQATITYSTDGKGNIGFSVTYDYPAPQNKEGAPPRSK